MSTFTDDICIFNFYRKHYTVRLIEFIAMGHSIKIKTLNIIKVDFCQCMHSNHSLWSQSKIFRPNRVFDDFWRRCIIGCIEIQLCICITKAYKIVLGKSLKFNIEIVRNEPELGNGGYPTSPANTRYTQMPARITSRTTRLVFENISDFFSFFFFYRIHLFNIIKFGAMSSHMKFADLNSKILIKANAISDIFLSYRGCVYEMLYFLFLCVEDYLFILFSCVRLMYHFFCGECQIQ